MAQKQHPSFSDVFSAVAPNVFRAKESFEDDIVELEAGLKDLVTVETVNFPVSETSATAALDGGFVFREVQIDDDPLRQAAWEEWAQEREASGEEWDEDDFVYDGPFDDTFLGNGVFVCGRKLVAVIVVELGVESPPEFGFQQHEIDELRSALLRGETLLQPARRQAELLLDRSMRQEWAQFAADLSGS